VNDDLGILVCSQPAERLAALAIQILSTMTQKMEICCGISDMNGYSWMKNGTSMDNGNRKMEDQWISMDINGNTIAESQADMMGISQVCHCAKVRLVLLQALLIRREPHN